MKEKKPRAADVMQGIYNSGMEWQRRALKAEEQLAIVTAERDDLRRQVRDLEELLRREEARA